jgi:hypothetical protein
MPLYTPTAFAKDSFSVIRDSLGQSDQLPLAEVIDEAIFQKTFDDHQVDFGASEDAIYTPSITLWALISQVFFAKENRSCTAAVMRIALLWAKRGRRICDTNNGDYCKARLKIPFEAVRQITRSISMRAELAIDLQSVDDQQVDRQEQIDERSERQLAPEVVARCKIPAKVGRVLMIDGFTVTAADTPENQERWPQNPSQKEGIGFPIMRCLALVSITTGLLIDMVEAAYCGKQTGETSLARQLFSRLRPGDVVIADCYLCTYFIVAACLQRDAEIVMKNHHKQSDDPLGCFRYRGNLERITTWLRPARPEWMSEQEYELLPETIVVRLVDVIVDKKGFRSERFTVATTILDRSNYRSDWIASIYRSRWFVELDIRSMKESLNMDILRAKSPAMVLTELWSCLLAYNLIRMKMLQSGITIDRDVRSMSFVQTMTFLASSWVLLAATGVDAVSVRLGQTACGDNIVGHRPDRYEPRVNKRRPKVLALMSKPRAMYHDEALANVAA